jgi:hypothetical protein
MKFTLRMVFVAIAIIAAYFAGWATAMHHYESQMYGMSHEKTNAVNEARSLRLDVEQLSLELTKCRSKAPSE